MYSNPTLSETEASVRQLWATATIRASSVGSTTYYAVGWLGKYFPLAYGHVKQPQCHVLKLVGVLRKENRHVSVHDIIRFTERWFLNLITFGLRPLPMEGIC
jgi:hypothetical protein